MIYDVIIIGGGILGLAVAREIMQRRPDATILLLEKEDGFARHQTGHNSGVIHAGVYYAPGSLKARLCKAGAEDIKKYCLEKNISFKVPGKLIVATSSSEMDRMEGLERRSRENGLMPVRLDATALAKAEPNIQGVGALRYDTSGIVSYREVCGALATDLAAEGATLHTSTPVQVLREEAEYVHVDVPNRSFRARRLIACAGLQADRIARLAGIETDMQIVPFRGEYYVLPPEKSDIVRHMIYPVPDPDLPFLGIHLTPMIDGRITLGPNAVLGFAREGYPKLSVNLRDTAELLAFRGFWPLVKANLRTGAAEMRNSLFKRIYLKQCRKFCPSLELSDLQPYEAGIRAQAVTSRGDLVQDFAIERSARMLHVLNAPSPAATSSFAIARELLDGMWRRERL